MKKCHCQEIGDKLDFLSTIVSLRNKLNITSVPLTKEPKSNWNDFKIKKITETKNAKTQNFASHVWQQAGVFI